MARYPGLRGEDVQATLAELTAVTISEQVLLSGGCERLLVCGGGARNPVNGARRRCCREPRSPPPMRRGSAAMIWKRWPLRLARRTLAGLPGNLPSVTGASEASVLGAIFPANPPQNRS